MEDTIEILINNRPIRLTKKEAKLKDIFSINLNVVRKPTKYSVPLFDKTTETFYYQVFHNEITITKTGFKTLGMCRADLILTENAHEKDLIDI